MSSKLGRSIVRSVVSAAWAAGLSVVFLLAGARWFMPDPTGPVSEGGWTRRSRAAFVPSGFHPAELVAETGQSFNWSSERSQIEIPGLRRTRAHLVTLHVSGGRPQQIDPAEVRVLVDGQVRSVTTIPNEPSQITFEIPRGPSGAVITIEVPNAYRPGGADKRALGVVLHSFTIRPVNGPWIPRGHAQGMLALTVFAIVLGLRATGLRGLAGAAAAAGIAAGCAWLVLHDAAFLTTYVDRLATIGAGGLAAGLIIGTLRTVWPTIAGVPDWGPAAGLVIALTVLKTALFWHPLAIVGDGIFQVHRAQVVHNGQYFFTSVTPKPFFEFPYPVALYVFAQPFWNWFPGELDLLRLLRLVALVADGLTALALYGAIRRQWDNKAMATIAAVLWPFATAPLQALSNANLTNLFGQSLFGAALAAIAWMGASSFLSLWASLVVALLLVIAFLSHFGTVTVGLATMALVGATLMVLGKDHIRRTGVRVFVIMVAAIMASWLVYYSHFIAVYQRSWQAVSARQTDDSSKIVAAPSVKLERWWSGTGDDYGRPGLAVLLAAAVGVALVIRQRRTGGGLVFIAWLLAWLALSALGVLTPITLRANLAAAPAFIALSAVAIGAFFAQRGTARIAAVLLGMLVAWDGLRVALLCVAVPGH